jgi:broad specificity phosphatase PhoE
VILVRHAKSAVDPTTPAAQWALSDEGVDGATELGRHLKGTTVVASTERKAIETAAALGPVAVTTSPAFCEVERPWYNGESELRHYVADWFSGTPVKGWESRGDAIARFARGIEEFDPDGLVIVTHGTVMTAWLSSIGAVDDALAFWSDLRMPDAWELAGGGVQRYPAA